MGNSMRKLGFLLLIVGFAWLALLQFNIFMRADLRSVGLAQYAELSTDPNYRYTREDVQGHIRDTALAVNALFPFILAPGATMLVGGLLLAFSPRRRKGQDAA
jgi:hypothetical protein